MIENQALELSYGTLMRMGEGTSNSRAFIVGLPSMRPFCKRGNEVSILDRSESFKIVGHDRLIPCTLCIS